MKLLSDIRFRLILIIFITFISGITNYTSVSKVSSVYPDLMFGYSTKFYSLILTVSFGLGLLYAHACRLKILIVVFSILHFIISEYSWVTLFRSISDFLSLDFVVVTTIAILPVLILNGLLHSVREDLLHV